MICSNATRDLCAIMLADSAFIQEHDTITFNKRRAKKGLPLVTPIIYTGGCQGLYDSVYWRTK